MGKSMNKLVYTITSILFVIIAGATAYMVIEKDEPAPTVVAEVEEPVVEEVADEDAAEEPAEAVAPEEDVEEAPAEEEKAEETPKKKGLFGRLFGKKK